MIYVILRWFILYAEETAKIRPEMTKFLGSRLVVGLKSRANFLFDFW